MACPQSEVDMTEALLVEHEFWLDVHSRDLKAPKQAFLRRFDPILLAVKYMFAASSMEWEDYWYLQKSSGKDISFAIVYFPLIFAYFFQVDTFKSLRRQIMHNKWVFPGNSMTEN